MTDRSDMEFCLRLCGKVEQILENYYSGRTSQSMLETRLVLEELTYYLVKKYGGEIDREDGARIGLVSLIFSKNLKRHTTQEIREYMRDINQITLPSLHFNSQNKKTKLFVFFRILTCPMISSPTFDAPINFKSNEIVTHGALPAERCAAVPAPASINADKYPPCVIPAAFK